LIADRSLVATFAEEVGDGGPARFAMIEVRPYEVEIVRLCPISQEQPQVRRVRARGSETHGVFVQIARSPPERTINVAISSPAGSVDESYLIVATMW
jgi:hypothetical protein